MAKFELNFKDVTQDDTSIAVNVFDLKEIEIGIKILGKSKTFIYLDKSTAIKFAKTLHTEINKITESEVCNG